MFVSLHFTDLQLGSKEDVAGNDEGTENEQEDHEPDHQPLVVWLLPLVMTSEKSTKKRITTVLAICWLRKILRESVKSAVFLRLLLPPQSQIVHFFCARVQKSKFTFCWSLTLATRGYDHQNHCCDHIHCQSFSIEWTWSECNAPFFFFKLSWCSWCN